MASARTTVVVVPSHASLLVFSAASFIILAPMFSVLSSNSISFATVTPSLVTIGPQKLLSSITFLPFGHIVTLTASATICIPVKISFLASSAYLICFAILILFYDINYIYSCIISISLTRISFHDVQVILLVLFVVVEVLVAVLLEVMISS
jgi:hypothetical protein